MTAPGRADARGSVASPWRTLRYVFLLAAVVVIAAPATAVAGEARIEAVTMSNGLRTFEAKILFYDAAPGERNDVEVQLGGTRALVRDTAGVSLGASCERPDQSDSTLAACDFGELAPEQEGLRRGEARITLGDGDDRARVGGSGVGAYAPGGEFDGGAGNDVLIGGSGSNRFEGGPGDDRIDAGGGGLPCGGGGGLIDEGSGPNGSDTFTGLGVVLYTRRTRSVEASIDGERNDGEAGEQDQIGRSLHVVGGEGDDLLVGNDSFNYLAGGGGSDELRGGAGQDVLSAASLDIDRFEPRAFGGGRARTADRLHGGDGDDVLTGSAGANVLDGGQGADTLHGLDGPDLLVTTDRSADDLRCGKGLDRARMDRLDFFRSASAQRCERPRRSVPGSAAELGGADPLQASGPVGDRRSAQIALGCPGDAPARCRGIVRLTFRGRTLGSARFRLRRNETNEITVRMTRAARRFIARRDKLTAVAVVRSRDRRGRVRETRVGGNTITALGPDYSGGYSDGYEQCS